jgi:hypothetical protein
LGTGYASIFSGRNLIKREEKKWSKRRIRILSGKKPERFSTIPASQFNLGTLTLSRVLLFPSFHVMD